MTFLSPCGVCFLQASPWACERYEISRNRLWVLRHHPDPVPLLGWLFLDARRHLAGPIDFNEEEATSWGLAVRQASQLVKSLTGCDRVYAIAFGEGARHLHLHLIPRFAADQATAAWSVADYYRAVERGERQAVDPQTVANAVVRARRLYLATQQSCAAAPKQAVIKNWIC